MIIRKTPGGGRRAYLFCREGTSAEQASHIRKAIENANLSCVASEVDGEACLEVRGCRDPKVLQNILLSAGAVKGSASEDKSDNEKFSFMSWGRNNMVMLYGAINVVADIGMIYYGQLKKKLGGKDKWLEEAAGWSYSAGSVAFTAFGRGDKTDYHASDIACKLRDELKQQGIALQEDSAVQSFCRLADNKTQLQKFRSSLSKKGSDAGNIATGTAGGFILANSLINKTDGRVNKKEAFLGATTLLSGYGAALVKEKAPDKENPPTTFFGKVKAWIEERPNRLAGYGYMLSTGFHAAEAVNKIRNPGETDPERIRITKRAYFSRGIFAGMNFIGEIILAMASKGHGSGVKSSDSIEETALSIVADTIVRQPEGKREAMIKDMGGRFLSNPDVLGGDATEMTQRLVDRVHRLEKSPWLGRNGNGSNAQSTASGFMKEQEATAKWAADKVKSAKQGFMGAVEQERAAQQVQATQLQS